MRHGLAINRGQGIVRFLPSLEAALAEAEASAGEIEAGLQRLDDALAELEHTERSYEAEMHRIRGEILLQRDPPDTAAAEQSLQAAIAIAQSQKARSFELRAALSLSRLWRRQGKPVEARQLLSGIYSWFTEGFETADLRAAKALLDKLSEASK
jgi:predicted ATPase